MQRKVLLYVVIVSLGLIGLIYSCQKSQSDNKSEVEQTISSTQPSLVSNNKTTLEGDPECNCPAGLYRCKADCQFTSCCVCCQPTQECGAGCTFGFSSCHCEAPEGGGSIGTVTVKHERVIKLFDYLEKDQKLKVNSISQAYENDIVKAGKRLAQIKYAEGVTGLGYSLEANKYQIFHTKMMHFLQALPTNQQQVIQQFTDKLQ